MYCVVTVGPTGSSAKGMHPSCQGRDNEACVFRQDLVKIWLVASRLSLVIGIILLVLKSNNVCINIPMQELWSMAVIPYQLSWSLTLSSASSSFLVLEILLSFMTWLHDQIVKVCPQLRGINKVLMHICNQDSNSSLWNISLLWHEQKKHCRIYDSVLSPISDKDWTMARPLKDVTTERASEASPCQLRRTTAPQNKHVQTHSKSLMTHHISYIMTSWEYEQ